jgi:hypothetical protein
VRQFWWSGKVASVSVLIFILVFFFGIGWLIAEAG